MNLLQRKVPFMGEGLAAQEPVAVDIMRGEV